MSAIPTVTRNIPLEHHFFTRFLRSSSFMFPLLLLIACISSKYYLQLFLPQAGKIYTKPDDPNYIVIHKIWIFLTKDLDIM